MFSLDNETADLIAARLLRTALEEAPSHHYLTVAGTVNSLRVAGKIESKLAEYLTAHADRFCMLPAPRFIEPVWYVEASRWGALAEARIGA